MCFAPAGGVETRRLQLRSRTRRDPDLLPGRRDHECPDALELLLVRDRVSACVDVTEASARSDPSPASFSRHGSPLVSAAVEDKTIVVLEGDETGQELLEEALRALAPDVT